VVPEVPLVPLDRDDEAMVRSWASTTAHTFLGGEPTPGDVAWRRERTRDHRITVGVDDGQVVATFRSFDTTLSVPGGALVRANGVSGVTVLATHRRRGLLTRWMTDEVARAAEAGHVASVLIASEAPIYGRYGFGVASTWCGWTVDTGRVRWRPSVPLAPGTLRVVSGEQWAEVAEPLHDVVSRRRAGSIARPADAFRWLGQLVPDVSDTDKKRRFVLHRSPDGEVDGALVHSVDGDWDDATLKVVDLLATDDAVAATLLRYACEVDFVRKVELHDLPPDWELPLLLEDPRAARSGPQLDGLYVRVHDVPAALTSRAYAVPGRVVLEVHDPVGQVDGRYLLEVDGSLVASCARVDDDAEPDVSLDVQGLAPLWLAGGTTPGLAGLVAAGRARVRDEATLARVHALFSWPTSPHVLTHF
jgi:predicted acetyltransferase